MGEPISSDDEHFAYFSHMYVLLGARDAFRGYYSNPGADPYYKAGHDNATMAMRDPEITHLYLMGIEHGFSGSPPLTSIESENDFAFTAYAVGYREGMDGLDSIKSLRITPEGKTYGD